MEKARKRIPVWLRYIINIVLFAAFLLFGKYLISAKIISDAWTVSVQLTARKPPTKV